MYEPVIFRQEVESMCPIRFMHIGNAFCCMRMEYVGDTIYRHCTGCEIYLFMNRERQFKMETEINRNAVLLAKSMSGGMTSV